DREQGSLGLDVVHVLRIVDAGILHRRFHTLGDDLDHARAADVFGLKLGAHGGAGYQTWLAPGPPPVVLREHGRVRRDDAIAASGPHHRDRGDQGLAARAVLAQHVPEGVIGKEAREVVDPTVAFRLSHDRDDLVGGELPREDALLEAGRVLDALELNLCYLDGHRVRLLCQASGRGSTWIFPSSEKSARRTVPTG